MRLEEAGVIWTTPKISRPLDQVAVQFVCEGLNGQPVEFELLDGEHQPYFRTTVDSQPGRADISVQPAGTLGVHYVVARTVLPNGHPYERYGCFRVEARTTIESDDPRVDETLRFLEEGLKLAVDVVQVDGKPITYIKCGDNTWDNLACPAFAIPALRYFITDMKTVFEAIYDHQWPSGCLPDHVYGDSHTGWEGQSKIRSMMADLESGMISTLYKGWVAHGDDAWVRSLLPKMEAGMEYVTTDPQMFDKQHGLVKRPHTMDEWDYQLGDTSCFINENSRFVVSQGDASSMFEACGLLALLFEATGNPQRAIFWRSRQEHYRRTGNRVFWDGTKYRHHVHLDEVDHGTFNEDDQLVMSNSWAITRGFADHQQAVAIIREYLRRWKQTGHRYPWWSVQPGYPTETTFGPGVYANGGLFPWVGGELCRAAFEHGMEDTAITLLMDFHGAVKRDHGAVFTWYDSEGNAGITSTSQTNYDGWGMQPWTQAVIEGLAGVRSDGKLFDRVVCCPRWPAAGVGNAFVTAHFPASDAYFAYRYAASQDQIELTFAGTGNAVQFRLLLPKGWQTSKARLDDQILEFQEETIEESRYMLVDAPIQGVRRLTITGRTSG